MTAIVTDASADPLGPAHARVYASVSVSLERTSDPDCALVPDQPPPAVQLVAFVDDHVTVDDPPVATLSGLAANVTVGGGGGGGGGGRHPQIRRTTAKTANRRTAQDRPARQAGVWLRAIRHRADLSVGPLDPKGEPAMPRL